MAAAAGYPRLVPKETGRKLVASNRKARHDYLIEDTYEAGLVLVGTEVKALRMGRASLVDGWEGLLAETLDAETIDAFAAGRGRAFAQLAVELGVSADSAGVCAVRWALADLAANVADSRERATVIERARALPPRGRLPRALRPLAVLAALGQRSLDSDGTALLDGPGAALLAVRVGMIGR